MFECVLISHGNLAEEFLNTIHMIAGDVGEVKTFGLEASDSIEEFQSKLRDYLRTLKKDVIVFCDLLGGSPMLSIPTIVNDLEVRLGLVTGMNLGMVIECLLQREYIDFKEAINLAQETGINGIKTIVKEDLYVGSTSEG